MTQINFKITGEEVQKLAGRKLGREQVKRILEAVENDGVLWSDIEKSIKDAVQHILS